jgi:hypothetical protein
VPNKRPVRKWNFDGVRADCATTASGAGSCDLQKSLKISQDKTDKRMVAISPKSRKASILRIRFAQALKSNFVCDFVDGALGGGVDSIF